MSIGNYLNVAAGLLLFIVGGLFAGGVVLSSIPFIMSASGFKKQGPTRADLLLSAIFLPLSLFLLPVGYAMLSEGFPFSIMVIAWVFRILGWLALIVAVLVVIPEINKLRLQRAPARDYRDSILIPSITIAVIAISTHICGITRSDRYYRDIVPSLTEMASYADSQAVQDSIVFIKPGLAVFNINREPIEVGWAKKTKRPNTIDDDVSFRLPRRILTSARRDLNTVALLDWTYIDHGSNWYQRTRNGLAVGEAFSVRRTQISCRVTLLDVASEHVIGRREFRGSEPRGQDTGSDPTGDIVNYLKEAVERAAEDSHRPA